MKTIRLIISCIMSIWLTTAVAQDAYYLHMKNGNIQVFYTDWVDSMNVSKIDIDGKEQETICSHEIWANDTVYRYALEYVDSVSFVTPKTEYQPEVINLSDNLRAYVDYCDSLSIAFNTNTPTNLLPKTGDKLVYTIMDDCFPTGFAGKVKNISTEGNHFLVDCELIELSQIFKCYYSTIITDNQKAKKFASYSTDQSYFGNQKYTTPHTISFTDLIKPSVSIDHNEDFNMIYSETLDGTVTITPDIDYRATLIVSPSLGTYVSFSSNGLINVKEKLAFTGTASCEKKFNIQPIKIPICSFVNLYFEPGVFARLTGAFNSEFEAEQKVKMAFLLNYSTKSNASLKNVWPTFRAIDSKGTQIGYINAKAQIGLYAETGLSILDPQLAKVYTNYELGANIESNIIVNKGDFDNAETSTALYEKLKDKSFKGNLFASVSVGAEALSGNKHVGASIDVKDVNSAPLFEYFYVPQFTEISSKRKEDKTSYVLSEVKLAANCTETKNVGIAFLDKNGVRSVSAIYEKKYKEEKDFGTYTLATSNVCSGMDFNIYPTVRVEGHDILATPSFLLPKSLKVSDISISDIKESSAVISGCVYGYDMENETGNVRIAYQAGTSPIATSPQTTTTDLKQLNEGRFCIPINTLESKTRYYISPVIKLGDTDVFGNVTNLITKGKGIFEDELVAFYKSANGDNWKDNTNWCSDKPINEWRGISTITRKDLYLKRGISLYLPSNNLSGHIQLNNSSLSNYIYFSGNNIDNLTFNNDTIEAWQTKAGIYIDNNTNCKQLAFNNSVLLNNGGDFNISFNNVVLENLSFYNCNFLMHVEGGYKGCLPLELTGKKITNLEIKECDGLEEIGPSIRNEDIVYIDNVSVLNSYLSDCFGMYNIKAKTITVNNCGLSTTDEHEHRQFTVDNVIADNIVLNSLFYHDNFHFRNTSCNQIIIEMLNQTSEDMHEVINTSKNCSVDNIQINGYKGREFKVITDENATTNIYYYNCDLEIVCPEVNHSSLIYLTNCTFGDHSNTNGTCLNDNNEYLISQSYYKYSWGKTVYIDSFQGTKAQLIDYIETHIDEL